MWKTRNREFRTRAGANSGELQKITVESAFYCNARARSSINSSCLKSVCVQTDGVSIASAVICAQAEKFFAQETLEATTADLNRSKNERIARIDSVFGHAEDCRRGDRMGSNRAAE